MRKFTFFLLLVLLPALKGYAVPAPVQLNKMSDVGLRTDTEFSTLTFTFKSPVKYRIEPFPSKGTYLLVFQDTEFKKELLARRFEDSRIKRIDIYPRTPDQIVAEIALKGVATTIYHSLSGDSRSLTIRLKQRTELMKMTGDTSPAEERAKKAKENEEAARKSARLLLESGKAEFKDAMEEFRKKDMKTAVAKLKEFLSRYPNSVYSEKAYYLLGESYYIMTAKERKYSAEAIQAFQTALARYPDSGSAARGRVRLGDLYSSRDLDVEALAVYDSLVKDFPGTKFSLHAMLGRSRIYLARNLYYEASNELEKILLLYPEAKEVKDAKFQIAQAYYLSGKYENAIRIFDSADKKWPSYVKTNELALYRYADTNFRLKNFPRSHELFMELMNLFPTTPEGREALNRLGDIYLEKGQVLPAVRLFGIQARLSPETAEGIGSRLRLASLGQRPDKVLTMEEPQTSQFVSYFHPLDTYNDIIKKHPGDSSTMEAYYQKAKLFHRQNRFLESTITLKALLIKFPQLSTSPQVLDLIKDNLYEMIRNLHDQNGDYAVLYTYYGNFDPFLADVKDPEIVLNIGDAYYEMGMLDRALQKYGEAKKLEGSGKFRDRLMWEEGRAYAAKQDYEKAATLLSPFAGPMNRSVFADDALYTLASVYEGRSEFSNAVEAYRAAIARKPGDPMVTAGEYRIGMLYKNQGKYPEAIEAFQRAIASWKPFPPENEYFSRQSHYELMESAYLAKKYADAAAYAARAIAAFPSSERAAWAAFVKSDCEAKLSQDEKGEEGLRTLAKGEPGTVFGKVALASVGNTDWKAKNKNLFPY